MRAGDLRHRVTIQSRSLASDGMGGWTETWSTFATVAAAVWPVSAKERISGQQLSEEITHRIRIRYLSGVLPGFRVLLKTTRYLNIISSLNADERNFQLDLLCTEVV